MDSINIFGQIRRTLAGLMKSLSEEQLLFIPDGFDNNIAWNMAHIVYVQELMKGDPIHFTAQIVGMDAKKIQIFYRMIHSEKGYLAATAETMHLHYDQNASKVSPMLEPLYSKVLSIGEAHAHLPVPDQAGRAVKQLTRLENRD